MHSHNQTATRWLVLFLFLLAGACTPVTVEPGAEDNLAYPGPTSAAALDIPMSPLEPVNTLQPGEFYIAPTMSPWPTLTPRATPTQLPGPTSTPFPLQLPASNAAGTIFFMASGNFIMELPVDISGSPYSNAGLLPVPADVRPILGPVSSDGRYLALLSASLPGGIPYIYDTQAREVWPLFRDHPQLMHIDGWVYGWHPNSRQVLFWSMNLEELWLVDAETGRHIVLALMESSPQGLALSPDGQRVIYIDPSGNNEQMWIASTAGSNVQPLPDPPAARYVFGWSPDNNHILYISGGGGYKQNMETAASLPTGGPLWIMNPEGGDRRPLSGPYLFGWGFNPSWSPDGQWVAFTGLDHGHDFGCLDKANLNPLMCRYQGTAVYIENVITGEVRRLTSGIEPAWSPDGALLAFISMESGIPEIWQVQIDGTALRQLTSDGQPKLQVIWSPAWR